MSTDIGKMEVYNPELIKVWIDAPAESGS